MSMWKVNLFQQIRQRPLRHQQISGYLLVPRETSARCICLSLIFWAELSVTNICFTLFELYVYLKSSYVYQSDTHIICLPQILPHWDLWDYAGDKTGSKGMEFSWEEDLLQVHSCHLGDQAPKICKSWVRFTGSTIPMLWCWNQADFRNMFKTLRLQWSNWSNGVSYCYFWLLFLWFMTSTTQEKKRKPLQYMKLDKFFMMLYIKQAGMLPTRCLSQTDKLIGFVHP